jgi:hypothetical protein
MHGALDLDAVLELDEVCRLAVDARKQLAAFDDLEIVETKPMARRRGEQAVRRVVGREQDRAKTLLGRTVAGDVELELVEAFLVEQDRAFRAEDLYGDTALAAPGGAVELDRPRRTFSRWISAADES